VQYRSGQGKRKKNSIPHDWMNCPPIAISGIANAFVVFKTPLDYKYNNKIAIHKRFGPNMVFQHMFSYQVLPNSNTNYIIPTTYLFIFNRQKLFSF